MKYCVVIIDGAAGLPLTERSGKTSLELAHTPNLDGLAREGVVGLCRTVPEGMEPSSACACMSVLGIDYSGRLLNLASRLTDIARPSGIVIDGSFGINLLSEEQQDNFEEAEVYLDGIHEYDPIQVYFTKEFTTIPKRNRQPIAAKRWQHEKDVKPYRDLLKFNSFRYSLKSEPRSSDDIKITIEHSKVIGGRVSKQYSSYYDFEDFTYLMIADKPIVRVDFAALREILKPQRVKKNMNVIIDIAYVEK